VLCGDFNAEVDNEDYNTLMQPFDAGGTRFHDAWRALNDTAPHAPTCGLFDHQQWPQGPHCRDYFFISHDLAEAVTAVEVHSATDASDHQPLAITLTEEASES
jgi:endonuclease/exonuclease/phosphatase family metal-dependent hydrolase